MRSTHFFWMIVLCAGAVACAAPESPPETGDEPAPQAAAEPEPEPEAEAVSPAVELDQIKTRLEAVKAKLFDEGHYNCCVQPSCDWCALHEGSCDCFTNLQSGEAVCPGCGLGWHNGEGIVDGIDAADVNWNITHEHPAGGHQH